MGAHADELYVSLAGASPRERVDVVASARPAAAHGRAARVRVAHAGRSWAAVRLPSARIAALAPALSGVLRACACRLTLDDGDAVTITLFDAGEPAARWSSSDTDVADTSAWRRLVPYVDTAALRAALAPGRRVLTADAMLDDVKAALGIEDVQPPRGSPARTDLAAAVAACVDADTTTFVHYVFDAFGLARLPDARVQAIVRAQDVDALARAAREQHDAGEAAFVVRDVVVPATSAAPILTKRVAASTTADFTWRAHADVVFGVRIPERALRRPWPARVSLDASHARVLSLKARTDGGDVEPVSVDDGGARFDVEPSEARAVMIAVATGAAERLAVRVTIGAVAETFRVDVV